MFPQRCFCLDFRKENMKNQDFVTYKQALKLKKLGFDWETTHYYEYDGELCENTIYIEGGGGHGETVTISDVIDGGFNKNAAEEGVCDAPTIEQALKWIRKIYKVDIVPKVSVDEEGYNRFGYLISRRRNSHETLVDKPQGFDEPEQAMLEAITFFFAILEEQYRADFNPQKIKI